MNYSLDPADFEKVANIFFPHIYREIKNAHSEGAKFSHYTSLSSAEQIIKNNCFWLRNAKHMNDFSEIDYGFKLVTNSLCNSENSKRLSISLNKIDPSLFSQISTTFINEHQARIDDSFIMSLSIHMPSNTRENLYGRLSMWRAYGRNEGVALILNNSALLGNSYGINAYFSPVLYADQGDFDPKFVEIIQNIEDNIEFLKLVGSKVVHDIICRALHFAVLSTKHPGFEEEQEWRVIYCPSHEPTGGKSEKIIAKEVEIGGIKQCVQQLRMINYPEFGLVGATLPEILDQVIIGPAQQPESAKLKISIALVNAGIENPNERIRVSEIPLRSAK